MTKAEIIRKLAKRVGVSDLDAKIFFEVFLRKVSQQLNPGETIKIKNFGYFQVRTGKLKNDIGVESENALADLIVFYPLKHEQDEVDENLIFNVPYKNEEEYNLIDSYFSLSFGKPVIPLRDANVSEYFIPPTGNEFRRLIDTKADKLLREVEVVDNIKGNEILIIDPELLNPHQIEINWEDADLNPDSPEIITGKLGQISLNEPETFTWDFSDKLEKQIEEESLLDTENDNEFKENKSSEELTWDFGEFTDEEDAKTIDFQRVESVTSSFNITPIEKDNSDLSDKSDSVSSEDSELLKIINEELKDEGFSEVKSNQLNNESEFSEKKEPIRETVVETPLIKRTPELAKRRGMGLYIIPVVILVIGGAVLFYFKYIQVPRANNELSIIKNTKSKVAAVTIERNYDIPITYPYAKDSIVNSTVTQIDKNTSSNISNQNNEKTQIKEQSDLSSPIKVKEFIYKSGGKYLVQVSAWNTRKSALNNSAFYTGKGYQTEIFKATLDHSTWFRVMVGNFNTEDEAVKFHNSSR